MLRLTSLELEGFGPFAEKQTISFPPGPGVVIVYGDNMRGKTTLLNAVRFAFFGKVLGRGSRARLIHTLSNRERASVGTFGFSVALKFQFDADSYELVRQAVPLTQSPASDVDYRVERLLMRNGAVLGPQEQERALAQMLPEDISRFFLFDGELLQEYEELIITESDVGPKISSAIERILGVPIVKAGRQHLNELAQDAEKRVAAEAKRHQDTANIGSALDAAIKVLESHQDELQRMRDRLAALSDEKAEIERKMAAERRLAEIMTKRNDATSRADAAAERQARARTDLKGLMAEAWRTLLRDPIERVRSASQAQMEDELSGLRQQLRRAAAASGHCEVCEQDIPEARRSALQSGLDLPAAETNSTTSAALRRLAGIEIRDVTGEVKLLVRQVQEAAVEERSLRDEANDLSTQLKEAGADTDDVRGTLARHSEINGLIALAADGVVKQEEKVATQSEQVARLRQNLRLVHKGDLDALEARTQLLRGAARVFDDAVEEYKGELRKKVEQSATALFRDMSTEKDDYAGLRINQDYGLTILHVDGTPEDARSAGAEHVIALSLMGALQNNAPLRGPIVMDSPFGRLDDGHTDNVLRTLPKLADQVVLLVYEAEVGRERARQLLKTNLLAEYELEKVNSRRTNIRAVG